MSESNLDLSAKVPLFDYKDTDVATILAMYNRTLESIMEDVRIIQSWLETQPHLPKSYPSDRVIASFLIRNKMSIEKTKEKIDYGYTIRTLIPEFYKDRLPSSPELFAAAKIFNIVPLPKLTKDLNRVMVCNFLPNSSESFNVDAFMSYLIILLDLKSQLDISLSDEYIVDFKHCTARVITAITPMHLKKELTVLEKVYSNRIKKIIFMNMNQAAAMFLEMLKPLLPKKLRERVYVIKNYEALMQEYPKDMIPSDFGGSEKSLECLTLEYYELSKSFDDYFRLVQNLEVNEQLRPQKLKNDEVLGYHGSFRKLGVD